MKAVLASGFFPLCKRGTQGDFTAAGVADVVKSSLAPLFQRGGSMAVQGGASHV